MFWLIFVLIYNLKKKKQERNNDKSKGLDVMFVTLNNMIILDITLESEFDMSD